MSKPLFSQAGPTLLALGSLVLLGAMPLAWAQGHAHQHGVATLDVAVEKGRITLTLETPLDNLLGFERAPRSEAERQQAKALVARLKAGEGLFSIDPAAGCRLASVSLESAALGLGPASAAADEHADLDGSFEFQCQAAEKAAWVEISMTGLPRLARMAVQVAAPAGQFKRAWSRAAPRISLQR